MATLKQVYDLAADHVNLTPRITAFIRHQANYVLGDGAAVEISIKLAKAVLKKASDYEEQFRVQVADNTDAQTHAYSSNTLNSNNIPDELVEYICGVMWLRIAGLYFEPTPAPPEP